MTNIFFQFSPLLLLFLSSFFSLAGERILLFILCSANQLIKFFVLSPFSIFLNFLCELFTYIVSCSPGHSSSKLLKNYSDFLRYFSHSDQRYLSPITLLISYPTPLLWRVVISRKNFHITELFFLAASSHSNTILSVT